MTAEISTLYDHRIQELRGRTRHPVRRRLLDTLAARKAPFAHIGLVLGFVSALFREAERRRSHGAVPLAFARGLYHRRTLDRYMAVLLAQPDGEGGQDFYVFGDILHVPHLRHSHAEMLQVELRWANERRLARLRKRKQRSAHRAQAAPNRRPQKVPSDPFCEVSRTDSSLREENSEQDKDSLSALAERMEALEAAEALAGVGCEQPQGQEPLTSAQVTELAYQELQREELARREASPVRILAQVSPLRGQLTKWGFDAERAARHRFTERELALAVEKIEKARTPLGNRAGAVVATILRWRRGTWQVAA